MGRNVHLFAGAATDWPNGSDELSPGMSAAIPWVEADGGSRPERALENVFGFRTIVEAMAR